ncbi:uncharacterized protein LOC106091855 isoform X3 [Stomoxys calcitrans]|uniref:uncharacterized protein LOC106091855 isoform X3 n=1 Tax=Stomoxys calcitrans TaxID=35570 RepID=UPI0027E25581|nr:uncharacterized protein LOC106091855 isoform X3 [Stomoxys calcitrans]
MAPISEKRVSQQQQTHQHPQTDMTVQSLSTVALLKEGVSGISSGGGGGSTLSHHHHNQHHHHQHNHHHNNNNHHHHHNHHHHQHAKENATAGRSSNGIAAIVNPKSLEILDFHESWLEEMEVYKDMMQVKKHVPAQLLGSHNHAHTPQGCQIDVINNHLQHQQHHHHHHQNHNHNHHHHASANKLSSHATTTTTASTAVNGVGNNMVNGTAKRRNVNDNKTRARVVPATSADASLKEGRAEMSNGNQLHLKRPREETPTKTAVGSNVGGGVVGSGGANRTTTSNFSSSHPNAKRSGHSATTHATATTKLPGPSLDHTTRHTTTKSAVVTAAQLSSPTANTNAYEAPANSVNIKTAPTTATPASPKHNSKIIVNQFHASSLLNGKKLDEIEKILTLNGLAPTPTSTANEASFYAAHYLNGGDAHKNLNNISNANHQVVNDNQNGHAEDVDDDPSSAIDGVHLDSDSDLEDDYVGEPFYLKEDGDETLQSKTKPYVHYTPRCILSPSLFPNVAPYLNYSSHLDQGPSMPATLHKVLKWKLSPAMPKIVKRVVLNSGFRIIKNTTDWMAVWERHMKSPGFRTIRSHQKYNHMPGSIRIGRKDSIWRSINENVKKFGTKEFGFMQKSYIMPEQLEDLRKAWPRNAARRTKWIIKPPASARGTGISIVNKWSQFPKDRPLVVQKYIERPLLINENKFDMRIYVILTSINPMRLYMYKDGLARFASVKYSSEFNDLDERCMHLTNYSINKFSENYAKNEDVNACQGHKWTLQSLWCCLEERGVNTKRLWATLRNLVIRALVSGEAGLNRMYRQNVNFRYNCFELFGFDVLLDENLIPWLLEINVSPSLHSDLPLDLHVKGPLIQAVLNTALYQVPPKLTEKQQKEILEELKLEGPLCHDKRLFSTCLRQEEIRKHNLFTNRSIEMREDYLDAILEHLQPDDVRCLLLSEDELNRCSPLERIFPTANTFPYLKFVDSPRYYNRLLDAWEHRYGHCREKGIEVLRGHCSNNYHLIVSEAGLAKEPSGTHNEIDALHAKKEETPGVDPNANANAVTNVTASSDMDVINNDTAEPASTQVSDTTNANELNTSAHTNATTTATATIDMKNSQNPSNELKVDRNLNHHQKNQPANKDTTSPNSNNNSNIATKHKTQIKSHETTTTTVDRKLKTDIKAS